MQYQLDWTKLSNSLAMFSWK